MGERLHLGEHRLDGLLDLWVGDLCATTRGDHDLLGVTRLLRRGGLEQLERTRGFGRRQREVVGVVGARRLHDAEQDQEGRDPGADDDPTVAERPTGQPSHACDYLLVARGAVDCGDWGTRELRAYEMGGRAPPVEVAPRRQKEQDGPSPQRPVNQGGTMSTSAEATRPSSLTTNDLGPLPTFLRPFVDWVARLPTTVHIKLLAGFGVIAILMFSMGIVCVGVLNRVDHQVDTLTALNEQSEPGAGHDLRGHGAEPLSRDGADHAGRRLAGQDLCGQGAVLGPDRMDAGQRHPGSDRVPRRALGDEQPVRDLERCRHEPVSAGRDRRRAQAAHRSGARDLPRAGGLAQADDRRLAGAGRRGDGGVRAQPSLPDDRRRGVLAA